MKGVDWQTVVFISLWIKNRTICMDLFRISAEKVLSSWHNNIQGRLFLKEVCYVRVITTMLMDHAPPPPYNSGYLLCLLKVKVKVSSIYDSYVGECLLEDTYPEPPA